METNGIHAVRGRTNVLLVAPHGNMKDDMGTSEFALAAGKCMQCYTVTNTRFSKGVNYEYARSIADLYKKDIFLHPELKELFWDRITLFLDEILAQREKALVIYIHGIKDGNIQKIAELTNGDPNHHVKPLDIVIGYGQHYKNPRFTAHESDLVVPLVESFTKNGLPAQIAPTDPIYSNGHKTWYCGNDRGRMNQYLFNKTKYRNRVQSLQVELKFTGVRDAKGRAGATMQFARSVQAIWHGSK
jgi:hypothetical protein